jgi:hypothetical protein
MLWRFLQKQRQDVWNNISVRWSSFDLQVVLWTLWSLMVAGVGFFSWHADVIASRPINKLGLVIHCVVAGVIGLVVMTVIEMRLEPWRFMDQ